MIKGIVLFIGLIGLTTNLKENTISEFVFLDGAGLVEYLLVHKLYWLNSNDIIEKYNKVYLPAIGNSKLVKK